MSDNAWTNRFAFYAASQFRLGNIVDAGFTASVLFEKYIEDELHAHGLKKSVNGDFLRDAIHQLSIVDRQKYDYDLLSSIRKIRNRSVIHNDDNFEYYNRPEVRRKIADDIKLLVEFVWKSLDGDRYSSYQNIDSIPHIHADMAVMGMREFFEDNRNSLTTNQNMIQEEDFDDLIHMRKHFLQLGGYLENNVLNGFNNLEVDLVSHVDTSSGYVWLAVNHRRQSPDHLRDRVRHSSVSIFATPFDLRISLDFGGEDVVSRDDYYKFLETDVAKLIIIDDRYLEFLDVEWYAFVANNRTASEFIVGKAFQDQLSSAKNKLLEDSNENRIITWERLLLGYYYKKSAISYEHISTQVTNIINIYYLFEEYRKNTLSRDNQLDWLPR